MFGAYAFGTSYFAQGGLIVTVTFGEADRVTTANAYFRRSATTQDGTFAREVTVKDGTFRRAVTTRDTER